MGVKQFKQRLVEENSGTSAVLGNLTINVSGYKFTTPVENYSLDGIELALDDVTDQAVEHFQLLYRTLNPIFKELEEDT